MPILSWLRKKPLDELTTVLLAPGWDDKTVLKAYKAALELGQRRDPKAIPALTKAMVDSKCSLMIGQSVKFVGVAAAEALAAIGTVEALHALKTSFRTENYGAKEVATAALRRRGISAPNPNTNWAKVFVASNNEVFRDTNLRIPNVRVVVTFGIEADAEGYPRMVEFDIADINGESAVLTADQGKALKRFFEASEDYNMQWHRTSRDLRNRILGC